MRILGIYPRQLGWWTLTTGEAKKGEKPEKTNQKFYPGIWLACDDIRRAPSDIQQGHKEMEEIGKTSFGRRRERCYRV